MTGSAPRHGQSILAGRSDDDSPARATSCKAAPHDRLLKVEVRRPQAVTRNGT